MAAPKWSLTAEICGSCKSSAAAFCGADSAFLCVACDARLHEPAAPRHSRVLICEVCEQAPASVTCKADVADLCASCDHDIHSANPLASRHERVPITPFYGGAATGKPAQSEGEEEEESWLIPNLNSDHHAAADLEEDSGLPEYKSAEYLFRNMDPYLDLNLFSGEQKANEQEQQRLSPDGVVPEHAENKFVSGHVVDGFPVYEMDYPGPKHIMYNFTSQSISHSVSSSSLDVGVVPDHHVTPEVTNAFENTEIVPTPLSGVDREASVLRYREKRKKRRFEKTIRYASRKAYAETRPRIKGRFAKRSKVEMESFVAIDGVVPSFF